MQLVYATGPKEGQSVEMNAPITHPIFGEVSVAGVSYQNGTINLRAAPDENGSRGPWNVEPATVGLRLVS